MFRILCALTFLAAAAPLLNAQFENLRTTDDGSALYFTTRLAETGTSQPAHGKVFRITPNGLLVEEVREREALPGQPRVTNNYFITGVDISGDGRLRAVAARRECGVAGCASLVNTSTTLSGSDEARQFPGPAQLSQNGRYLVNTDSGIPRGTGVVRQWDLETGESWPLVRDLFSLKPVWTGRIVANDGTALGAGREDLFVQRRNERRQLTFGGESVLEATIDAEGRAVVFTSRWPAPHDANTRIRRFDLATGELRTVVEGFVDYTQPSVSNDGSVMTVLCVGQLFFIRSEGGDVRQLTDEPDRIKTAILSGDGRVAYALTFGGRILRIDVESGAIAELLGRTLSVTAAAFQGARGSALVIPGAALDEADVKVTIGGLPAPLIGATAAELTVQIPWEAGLADQAPLRVESAGSFAFAAPLDFEVRVSDRLPRAFGRPLHEDGVRPVWQGDPARPNEEIHIFATGLGQVVAPVQTGVPQPAEPAPVLSWPLACYHGGSIPGPRVEVLYAGLAPEMLGVYLLSVRLPASTPQRIPGSLSLWCVEDGGPIEPSLSLRIPFQ
jgi:uncharacterized protein (TIGR03437 family)